METISRLREERAQLVARLEQIDKILRKYDELDQEAKRLLTLTDESKDATKATSPESPTEALTVQSSDKPVDEASSVAVERTKTPMTKFEAAVLDVMRESGRPMDRTDLYDALTARGIVIGDGDRDKELNTLSARLYRMAKDGHLASQRGQGYRLRGDDEVPAQDEDAEETVNYEDVDDPLR